MSAEQAISRLSFVLAEASRATAAQDSYGVGFWLAVAVASIVLLFAAVALRDITQKRHAIIHNFPVVGHFRYMLESIGPELRQYIVAKNDEERPFSRDQRRWVYASSKKENNYFGFGTDIDLEAASNHMIIKHSAFPLTSPREGDAGYDANYSIPCTKILGEVRGRKKAFRPSSIINVSGMSFGSLSAAAIQAINRGCQLAGCMHNTGEGGVSKYHLQGGDLIWQLGTGYFGARDSQGRFDKQKFLDVVAAHPVRAIEIKLSQGAKPGLGGMLPKAKITREIATTRSIPMGMDCASPSRHSVFGDIDSMLDFVEDLAESSGLPVGIKSAVGEMQFWENLVHAMSAGDRGVDFITIDGGEGGTGAAPLVFSDFVALPFKLALSRVYRFFVEAGIHNKVVFVGSGKLGFPQQALLAMSLGCDLVHVAREPMLAIGCIQAQACHTGHCPTGIATQSKWLMRGLDPTSKGDRMANYVTTLRKEILQICHACGVSHPAQLTTDQFDIIDENFGIRSATDCFKYQASWSQPTPAGRQWIEQWQTTRA